ncbi:synaptotagmin-C-like [Brienomyrus brachyistius]|uniref:synaptotagmin-C-like n=1 Tax=Brienomyrus brachyistius TaxID=42636 RepID=UPI0020B3D07E|nr:synaptotagmin-C-like [Brienomyrus brachyistius]XP_048869666.1 synaptotagmin-C-like [Brienomyrus brachyistius]XP_048871551.1 synaptotagmin-C-like [Brienomyrus brachyistius]XP_048871552.1 synaptotagmin-C-like [Brienomyrus brachyistius]
MSGDWEEHLCKKALMLLEELCFHSPRGYSQNEHCQEFSYLLTGRKRQTDSDISVSLLSVIVTFCGIVLLSVSLFVSWKLCWLPWRDKEGGGLSLTAGLLPGGGGVSGGGGSSLLPTLLQRRETHSSSSLYPSLSQSAQHHPHFSDMLVVERGEGGVGGVIGGPERAPIGMVGGPHEMQEHSYLDMDCYPNAAAGGLKLSQTSPELPPSSEAGPPSQFARELPNAHSQQQVTARPRPMTHQLSSPDFHGDEKSEQLTSIGQIKPELYKPRQGEQGDAKQGNTCGKISFLLRYAFNTEQLIVKILKALDLPAKDANGFSDPYVKIYLLPDRKKKFQTKVHRKTLNPVFNETFQFGVPLAELHNRKLHFSIYDFDRFSRHDLIGQVVVDNLLDFSEGSGEKPVWRDIVEGTAERADLGELNFSLCYLPTAGRLTATVIKATNLKAMDLTGFSDPYVKASLICDGRRLKKRKTSTKKNTLNPIYNEALVFDIPNENIDNVSLIIAVMDYDCIGHNEVIGMCRVGSDAEGPGREHWAAMLANPRKPIEHWHQLVEEKSMSTFVPKTGGSSSKPHIVVDSPHSE